MTVRIRVIPCLDVRDGRVVKGVNFVDLRDAGDPVEQAQAYDAAGADELCFLDISASHEGRGTLLDMVRRTAEVCFMPLTVGGGVSSVEDARALLLAGDEGTITAAHIMFDSAVMPVAGDAISPATPVEITGGRNLSAIVRQSEAQVILDTLDGNNGNRLATAKALGISERTLRYRLASMREAGLMVAGGAR